MMMVMVGRFNVRPGDGVSDWLVWDNAMNGHRGRGLSQAEAAEVAADLESQYDVHGAGDQANIRRVSPPVPGDAWQRAGVLDAWVLENGRWAECGSLTDGSHGSTRTTSARRPAAHRHPRTKSRRADARPVARTSNHSGRRNGGSAGVLRLRLGGTTPGRRADGPNRRLRLAARLPTRDVGQPALDLDRRRSMAEEAASRPCGIRPGSVDDPTVRQSQRTPESATPHVRPE